MTGKNPIKRPTSTGKSATIAYAIPERTNNSILASYQIFLFLFYTN